MSDKARPPVFLIMVGIMLLIVGILTSILGFLSDKPHEIIGKLDKISTGGEHSATNSFEQAVNRYMELEPPLSLSAENDPARVAMYLEANRPLYPHVDKATQIRRISFRRNWSLGFGVERLGVVDIHNLTKLNFFRALFSKEQKEIKRLAEANRTLANYLEFDPMISSVEVYAPASHIYLFTLENALSTADYSKPELIEVLNNLKSDTVKYHAIFTGALRNERALLEAMPETANAYEANPGTTVMQKDFNSAYNKISRMIILMSNDYNANRNELDEWSVPDGDELKLTLSTVPGRSYARLLAALTTHNRLAQTAIQAELFRREAGRIPEISEIEEVKITDAQTGENFMIEAGQNSFTVKSGSTGFTVKFQ